MQLNEKRAAAKVTKEDESKFRKQEIEGKELDKKLKSYVGKELHKKN